MRLLLLFVLLSQVVFATSAWSAPRCVSGEIAGPVVHGSEWVIARVGARQAWEREVARKFGASWGNWQNTKVRGFICDYAPNGQKRCFATAKACGRTELAVNRDKKVDPFRYKGNKSNQHSNSKIVQGNGAGECKRNLFSAKGSDRSGLHLAKSSARRSWHNSVQRQFGRQWATWSNSVSRSYDCEDIGTRIACTAIAQPCKARNITSVSKVPPVLEARREENNVSTNGNHKDLNDLRNDEKQASNKEKKGNSIWDNIFRNGNDKSKTPKNGETDLALNKADRPDTDRQGKVDRKSPDSDISVPWRQIPGFRDREKELRNLNRPGQSDREQLDRSGKSDRAENGNNQNNQDSNEPFDPAENKRDGFGQRNTENRNVIDRNDNAPTIDRFNNRNRENETPDVRADNKNLQPYFPDREFVEKKLRKIQKKRRPGLRIKPWPKKLLRRNRRLSQRISRSNESAKGDRITPNTSVRKSKKSVKPEPGTTDKLDNEVSRSGVSGNNTRDESITGQPVCTPVIEASGTNRYSKRDALKRARRNWRNKVISQFGQAYGNLNLSRGYKAKCRREGQLICTVKARACRRMAKNEKKSSCSHIRYAYLTKGQRSRSRARQRALAGWQRKVAKRLGKSWAYWRDANKPKMICNKWRGYHVCRATAAPCNTF